MKVFKIVVETAPTVPDPTWERKEVLIVAESEKDARNLYHPGVTQCYGAMFRILSCELLGNVTCVITDEIKASWDQDDGA